MAWHFVGRIQGYHANIKSIMMIMTMTVTTKMIMVMPRDENLQWLDLT